MELPDLESFFKETPLYEKYDIAEEDAYILFGLIYFQDKLDCYCPSCERDSTFIGTNESPELMKGFRPSSYDEMLKTFRVDYKIFLNEIHHINLYCSRVEEHKMQFNICTTSDKLFKIGQFPSIAEISQPELKKYRKILSKEKYSELNRAVGLATHGIGIGSFVYLRRIFEDLIEEAHLNKKETEEWDEELYVKSRMAEKIQLLKTELPEFLVTNKVIYGILSKGIHELKENDCLEYFPTIKLGIELILDEKIELMNKQKKSKLAESLIKKISFEIKDK